MYRLHESITEDMVEDAARESLFGMMHPGFCLSCGAEIDGIEPDAGMSEDTKGDCECCGETNCTIGAETALCWL